MLKVSNDFHAAFKETEREILVKVKIKNVEYTANKIKEIKYTTGAMGGDKFQIGTVQAAAVKITFSEVIEGLKELDKVELSFGIKIPSTGKQEYVSMGIFFISGRVDPDRNEGKTIVEALDSFIFMEGSYTSKLKYPAKLSDVALEIANMSRSILDPVSFNHLSPYTINKPEGYTYRQAIGIIAQYEAGFACFDRDGNLAIRKLADPKFKIEPNEYFLKGLTKSELLYQIKGITCKVTKREGKSSETKIISAGSTNGIQIEIENNTMTQFYLEQVFEKVRNLNYFPISLKWRGNPALEIGDWVTMTDRLGKQFKSPVLSYSITYDGGLTSSVSADSKAQAPNVAAFKGPLQQKLDDIYYRIDAAGTNNIYEGTVEPSNPREGDLWFKPNGPDMEILVYGLNDEGMLDWVLKTSTVGITEAQEAAEKAKELAEAAEIEAKKATEEANAAVEKATQAANDADDSLRLATNAKENALQAKENATKAMLDATEAWLLANTAQTDAANALQGVAGVETMLSAEISILEGKLLSKVNVTEFNALEGTVSSHTTTLGQHASEIAMKASQSEVNTINQTVKELNAELVIQAGKIDMKANQTYVDSYFAWQRTTDPDMNNYKTRGNFYVRVAELLNAPLGGYAYLKVEVIEGGRIQQTFQKDNNPRGYYTRVTTNSLGQWGTWRYYADGQDLDAVNATVTSLSAELSVQAGKIELKASQTSVDVINQQVEQMESSFTVQAGEIKGLITKTDGLKTDVSSLIASVDMFSVNLSKLEADTLEAYANFSMSIDSIEQTVANKADASQVIQLGNQITSAVGDVNSIKNNTYDLIPYFERGTLNALTGAEMTHASWVRSSLVEVRPNVPYLIFDGVRGVTVAFTCWWYWYDENQDFLEHTSSYGASVTSPLKAAYCRVSFSHPGAVDEIQRSVIQGTEPIKMLPVNKSQITQLKNAINLRVQANNIINQINISPEEILIAGNKIRITGQTFIENGVIGTAHIKDAAITNAKIGNISADKINAGSINAANVNIINMNASNITSGYLNAARIQSKSITADKLEANFIAVGFNAYSNTMKLSPTSLEFYSGLTLTGKLTSEGQEFWNGKNRIGSIGESAFVDKPNIRGVRLALSEHGRYLTFSYRQSATAQGYTPALILDPYKVIYNKAGLYLNDFDMFMSNANTLHVNRFETMGYATNKKIELAPFALDGKNGIAIFNSNQMSGIFLGDYGAVGIKDSAGWRFL